MTPYQFGVWKRRTLKEERRREKRSEAWLAMSKYLVKP